MHVQRKRNPCDIDDESIEMYALGRLEDADLRGHIDMCANCAARVNQSRRFIALMKKTLARHQLVGVKRATKKHKAGPGAKAPDDD